MTGRLFFPSGLRQHTKGGLCTYTDNGKIEALGEPTTVIDPLGHKTQFQYNNRGDVTAVLDAIGRTTSYIYNPFHQVTEVMLPPLIINGPSRYLLYTYQFEGGPLQAVNYYDETNTFQRSVYYGAGSEGGGEWGNYTDLETGLVLMGYRYYSPGMGRFLTRDPIGYEGGINLYAYCRNNPIMNADPMGLDGLEDLSNFFAGAGDSLSCGLTALVRQGLGCDDVVDN